MEELKRKVETLAGSFLMMEALLGAAIRSMPQPSALLNEGDIIFDRLERQLRETNDPDERGLIESTLAGAKMAKDSIAAIVGP